VKYAYEDLSDSQFEELIVFLCKSLLGISVQGFSRGPDGGRDAKFVGTAELHPSRAAPWAGTTIIQAKHTNGINRSFSESDFFSSTSDSTVIAKEISRIKSLRINNQLDHYMLFANRRLSGSAESDIRSHISSSCDIPEESIYLCGIEQLEMFWKDFPDIPRRINIDPVDFPLIISPDDLAEIVEALARQIQDVSNEFDDPPTRRVTYEQKNQVNNMTNSYARELLRKFLPETEKFVSVMNYSPPVRE
jgi:hypothetical protein